MATQDNSSGLLSKVAKFVRNPTTDWADLDKVESELEPDSDSVSPPGYNKLALKNMIERKRHDDGIRKREFDQLRKLRRNTPVMSSEMTGAASLFRGTTSYSDLDERAMTLKKIDEIEAQMSKQWWKGRNNPALGTTNSPVLPVTIKQPEMRESGESLFDKRSAFPSTQAVFGRSGIDDAPTLMGLAGNADSLLTDPTTWYPAKTEVVKRQEVDSGGFAASKLFAVEMSDSLSDPELEEAAIRFANGDDAGAESVLLTALQTHGGSVGSADVWAVALFDLYRGTGQHASFESLALDYAKRFGRTAPAWFSTPEQLGLKSILAQSAAKPSPNASGPLLWHCPAALTTSAIAELQTITMTESTVWSLNWVDLQTITPSAAQTLAKLFANWCETPVAFHFESVEVLERVLREATQVGNKKMALFWWQLRLDMCRILRLQDDFELVALDYCVTYEVSPPPWRDARCKRLYQLPNAHPPESDVSSGVSGAPNLEWGNTSSFPPSVLQERDTQSADEIELTGELQGDAANVLISLEAASRSTKQVVISCERLIRVDFSAAGSILNWVANGESLGCQIEFQNVPCLVAAFFNLIGINEHAQVITRTN